MECNRDEAARAKALAERKMLDKDFVGAKKMVIKLQRLLKQVEDVDIQKMFTVCDVHCAAGAKVNNEIDWYGILQVPVNADDTLIQKQYRKFSLLLHPDKNKFGGAEAAFKLVGEANITLTDRSKRSVHDKKRNTFRSVTARPNHQPPKRPAPARSSSTPVNLHNMHQQHQHQASNPTGLQTTFWTSCPACGMEYQYYLSILNKDLRCLNCLKPFIAHDLKDQAIPSGANQQSAGVWKNAGAPQNFTGPQSNVTGQKVWSATPGVHVNTVSHHANVNTKRETDGNASAGGLRNKMKTARATRNPSKSSLTAGLKRGRRAAFESSESSISETSSDSEEEILKHGPSENCAGPGRQTRRSSRQKQEVKYNENSDDDHVEDDDNTVEDVFFDSPAFKRFRKTAMFHGDHSTKTAKLNEDTAGCNGLSSCSNIKDTKNVGTPCEEKTSNGVEQMKRETMHSGENSDGKEEVFHSVSDYGLVLNDDDASDDNKFTFLDPQFFDFDKLRDASQFRANQIWAVYDDQGCMPRFYARITRVKLIPKLILNFVWLEFNPATKTEEAWSYRGLPVACGQFKHGQTETTNETGMFSRTISFERSKKNNLYEINPRKGEVWALFKGWDIVWSSDAGNQKKSNYQYEVVQVLSDLTTSTSIIVMPLVKIKGYVRLFMQSGEAAPYVIPQGDTLRFSHCVPHHLIRGTEKEGIPEGSLELDPAALPFNLEEAFPSANPECSSVRSQDRDSKHAGLSSGDGKGSMNVGQRQHTKFVNVGIPTKTLEEEKIKHNTHLPEDSDDDNADAENDNTVGDDFVDSPALKSLRKNGLFHSDNQSNKTAKLNEDIAGHNGPINGVSNSRNMKDTKNDGMPCGEQTSNGVEQMKRETMHAGENSDGKEKLFHSVSTNGPVLNDDDASEDNKFHFPDPEFFDFDQLRNVSQFKANQIWAVYDDQGCMPRFYARITRVKVIPKFMLHFVWLEFDPANKAEAAWSYRGLPVACGHFKHGQLETTKETGMFSRTISFGKSKTKNCYEIYPRKGEVWALFKGWDIGWSSDAGNQKRSNYQYEIVEVLSDLTTSSSIIVMPLVKIKGYVSLFMQSGEAAPYVIPQGDTLRFSHCVPHHLMRGTEKEGIPEGSLELDPAAFPFNLEEAFPSANQECSSVRSQDRDSKHAGLSSGDRKGSMNVGQRQHTKSVNVGIPTKTSEEEKIKHNTHLPEVTDVDDDDNVCQTEYVCAESEFYDFSEIRLLQRFSPGQIWALYSDIDKFPNYYAFIQKVDLKNDKVQVRWLDVCPQGEVEKRLSQERTISIGTFRLSSVHEMVTYTGTDAFSHPVEVIHAGRKGEYEILPRLGEIWAVYKNWGPGWTAQDFEECEYELVEILGHTDSSIQVQLLRKVDGYKMVFMSFRAAGSVKTIRRDEYPKFSHEIPCFHLTHEKSGKLRGYLELDSLSLPVEFLY